MKLGTNIYHVTCVWALLKRFPRSDVKGQGRSKTKCTFYGGGLHFNGVMSRLTCLMFNFHCPEEELLQM